MIIHEQKQNAMEKQEILYKILTYEKELRFIYEEYRNAFGNLDEATQSAFKEWNTIDELINRLNLQNETI
jgi:hypothetical protein